MTSLRSAKKILSAAILIVAACSESAAGSARVTPSATNRAPALNVVGSVDAGSSARGAGGTVLARAGPGNGLAIATNIGSSFATFEDDDRNGVEDHRR